MKEIFKPPYHKIARARDSAQFPEGLSSPLKDFRWRMTILEDSPLGCPAQRPALELWSMRPAADMREEDEARLLERTDPSENRGEDLGRLRQDPKNKGWPCAQVLWTVALVGELRDGKELG